MDTLRNLNLMRPPLGDQLAQPALREGLDLDPLAFSQLGLEGSEPSASGMGGFMAMRPSEAGGSATALAQAIREYQEANAEEEKLRGQLAGLGYLNDDGSTGYGEKAQPLIAALQGQHKKRLAAEAVIAAHTIAVAQGDNLLDARDWVTSLMTQPSKVDVQIIEPKQGSMM